MAISPLNPGETWGTQRQKINDNDADLDTRVASHETRITSNETELADHETRITANESSVSDFGPRIAQNETDIAAHGTRITDNETAISDLDTRVGNNETAINNHESRIAANETAITDHGTRISTNETAISDHETRISQNETDIGAKADVSYVDEAVGRSYLDDPDINQLTTPGIYSIYGPSSAPGEQTDFGLVVAQTGTDVIQIFFDMNSVGTRRSADDGATWSNWVLYATAAKSQELQDKIDALEARLDAAGL